MKAIWTRHAGYADFLRVASLFLRANELENSLLYGIAARGAEDPDRWPNPLLLTLGRGDEVIAAAVRTPPWKLVFSHIDDEHIPGLVELIDDPRLPEMMSTFAATATFVSCWCERTGAKNVPGIAHCLFRLDEVVPPRHGPGALRQATLTDSEQVADWLFSFDQEIGLVAPGDVRERGRAHVRNGNAYLYVIKGRPVGMAVTGGRTPNSVRIGGVYTPPEQRGRGIASRLVADLSQRLLDEGCAFTTLFTEKENPTSNKIYQAIGYQLVGELDEQRFVYEQ